MSQAPLLSLREVSKFYALGDERLWVLRDVSIDIDRGDFVAIVGPSGSGKSTLMNILGCLTQASEGEYYFDGAPTSRLPEDELAELRNRSIGFIFQQFHLLPRQDAVENVLLPVQYLKGSALEDFRARARALLSSFGLGDRLSHKPNELSGGQRQKLAISRALLLKPDLILADEPTGNLDSKSASDILRELEDLHSNGHTILLVTHDAAVAARAHRQITIADGKIVSDTRRAPFSAGAGVVATAQGAARGEDDPALSERAPVVRGLSKYWQSYARPGLDNIGRSRGRSLLTMLGVIIGVAAVIAMITLGNFARDKIMGSFQSFGTNLVWVWYSKPPKNELRKAKYSQTRRRPDTFFEGFDYERDILGMKAAIPDILDVSPEMETWNVLVQRKSVSRDQTRVKGVNEFYAGTRGYSIARGRGFFRSDIKGRANVALIGKRVADDFFPGEDPVGQEIRVQRQQRNGSVIRLQVIGVLNAIDADEYRDPNDVVLVPFTVVQNKFKSNNWQRTISSFLLTGRDFRVVGRLTDEIKNYLTSRYSDDVKFEVFAKEQYLKEIRKILGIFQGLLGGIAILSLLVGGIGIMNMMLVTVTERTREIGLRKALGAQELHIERLFVTESVALCLTGGAIGIALGVALSNLLVAGISLIYKSVKFSPIIDTGAVLLAFAFSVIVGVVFGVYPARKAARLDPVDALRWE